MHDLQSVMHLPYIKMVPRTSDEQVTVSCCAFRYLTQIVNFTV